MYIKNEVLWMQYVVKDVFKTKEEKEREEKIIEIIKKQINRST